MPHVPSARHMQPKPAPTELAQVDAPQRGAQRMTPLVVGELRLEVNSAQMSPPEQSAFVVQVRRQTFVPEGLVEE